MPGMGPTLLMWTVAGLLLATTGAATDKDDTADTIIVRRGQTVEITSQLASGFRQHCSVEEDCQVSITGNNSRRCGYLQPERFNTSTDDVPVIFSHFGCGETHVPLDFRILKPDGQVRFATLELTVAPSNHSLSPIMESIQIVPLRTEDDAVAGKVTFNLSVTFYTRVTWQECTYSISFYPFYLQVPERGRLVGDLVNERIPCGYKPLVPIQYETDSLYANDYLLVTLWDKHSAAATTPVRGIVNIKLKDLRYNHRHNINSLMFTVHQTGYTLVPAHLLIPFPHSLDSLSSNTRLYSSSTSCGRFATPFSPRSNADDGRTLITIEDLRRNAVAFHQFFANCSEIDYHLHAYDVAGSLLWKMLFKAKPDNVRTAPTLHYVAHEGSALNITSMLLRLSESFDDWCTFRLVHELESSNVLWRTTNGLNSSAVGKLWSHPFETGSLWYAAGGRNGVLVWEVACDNQPYNVTAFVTVIGKDKLPRKIAFQSSEVHVYEGYATQLDSRLLHWTDPDSDDFAAVYFVASTSLLILDVNISNVADTILPLRDLGIQENVGSPTNNGIRFSHADWLNGRIWIASRQTSPLENLNMLVYTDANLNNPLPLFLDIHVHSSPPPGPLCSYKKATAVRVVLDTNVPLILGNGRNSQIMYETSLKARDQGLDFSDPTLIVYHVRVAPQHGYICVGRGTCKETARNFTQQDIQNFSVRYVRRTTTEVDAFSFYLDDSNGQIHWFVIRTTESVIPVDPCGNGHLYIPVPKGGQTTLAVRSFQHSVSEDTALEVVRAPQHGYLSMDLFTGTALYAGNVSYVLRDSSRVVCTDEVIFSVSTNSSHFITILRFAVMMAPYNLAVSTSLLRITSVGHSQLRVRDLSISGVPFCPELVQVKITGEPQFGTLQTLDTRDLKLKEGCSFSQLQLQQNKVIYKIAARNVSSFSDSISFLVTVPLIGDDLNITTDEFTMEIYYSNQTTGQLMVVPQLPLQPIDIVGEGDLLYGVSFEVNRTINITLPEYTNPNRFVLILQPSTLVGGSFIGPVQHRIDLRSVFWPYPYITVPLIYYFNISSLPTSESSVTIDIASASLTNDNEVQHFFQGTSVWVYWSHVSFVENHLKLEAKQERQEISIGMRRVGSITEVSEVMIRVTYTDKAIILECPPAEEHCVSNSSDGTTFITFLPNIERAAVPLIVSVGPEWMGGSALLEVKLVGVVNAVTQPPLDRMTIELLEYSWIQFSGPLNITNSFGPQRVCDFITTVEEPSSPTSLSLRITRQGNLAERIGVICYTRREGHSLYPDFEERHVDKPSSIVYFEPNASDAICNVKIFADNDPEGTERFTVGLQAVSDSWSHVNTTANTVCVFITDTDSESEVFFPQAVVRAREPNQEATAVDVTLRRKLLVNYGVQTTVFYRTVSGSATEDEDYIHEDSVTVFNGDQVEASITIQILPGREWFKEESFSLEIYRVEEGVIRDLRDVVTVIIEGGEVVVGFTEEEYFFLENEGGVEIPVVRRGNLSVESSFYCLLENVSLSNMSSATSVETHTSEVLHVLTFHEGQDTSSCSIDKEDTLGEGTQVLRITLLPVSEQIERLVRFHNRPAKIHILDKEDVEVFRFSARSVTVTEPVTNFDVDHEPLNAVIVREGDNTMETTVGVRIYSPTADTAHLGQDFKLVSDVVVFRPGQVNATIPVRVLATPAKWTEMLSFVLELQPTGGERWAKKETAIDPDNSKLTVHIEDRQMRGPFFPALPVVISSKGESFDQDIQEGVLSALFPLICRTPCDPEWTGAHDYTEFCRNESINILATKFVWEVSQDGGSTFTELNLTTPLASAKRQWLDPIFLSPGQQYRCKVAAGSHEGMSNHVRTSRPVRVYANPIQSCPHVLPRIQVELTSLGQQQKTTFTSTDVVQMDIRLNRIDNMFPLVSTSTFVLDLVEAQRSVYSRRRHKCSNFVLREIHSFWGSQASAPHPLLNIYQSLSPFCYLEFRSWHRITDLVQECGTEVHSGPNRRYRLSFHAAYFNATYTHLQSSFSANVSKTIIIQPSSVESKHPLKAVTAVSPLQAILEPLDLAVNDDLALEVILRSTILSNTGSQFVMESFGSHSEVTSNKENLHFKLSLVATSNSNRGNVTQLWQMTSRGSFSTDYSGNYTITLLCQPQPPLAASHHCLWEGKGHKFHFRIDRSSSSSSSHFGYHFSPTTELSVTSTSGIGDAIHAGDTVNATVVVRKDQVVKNDLKLQIKCVCLCPTASSSIKDIPDGCRTVYKSDSPGAGWNLSINAHGRLTVSFSFEMESLQVGCWHLVVNYSFVLASGEGQYTSVVESSVSTKLTVVMEASPTPSSHPSLIATNSDFQTTEPYFISALLIFGIVCIIGIVALTLVFLKWRTKHPVDLPRYNARVFRHSTTKTCVTPSGKVEAGLTVEMTEISCSSSRSDHLHSALDLVGEARAIPTHTNGRVAGVRFRSLPQLCPEGGDNGAVESSSSRHKDKDYTLAVPRVLPVVRKPPNEDLTEHIERTLAAAAPSPAQSHLVFQTDL